MRTDIRPQSQARPYPYRIVAIGTQGWQVRHNDGYRSCLYESSKAAQLLAEYLYDRRYT